MHRSCAEKRRRWGSLGVLGEVAVAAVSTKIQLIGSVCELEGGFGKEDVGRTGLKEMENEP
jgi:hypothetical protein